MLWACTCTVMSLQSFNELLVWICVGWLVKYGEMLFDVMNLLFSQEQETHQKKMIYIRLCISTAVEWKAEKSETSFVYQVVSSELSSKETRWLSCCLRSQSPRSAGWTRTNQTWAEITEGHRLIWAVCRLCRLFLNYVWSSKTHLSFWSLCST